MKLSAHITLFGFLCIASICNAVTEPQLILLQTLPTGDKKGTEIISIQASTQKLITSNSKQGRVDVYSIANPNTPVLQHQITLHLANDEQITSAAIHPQHPYILAAIQAASPSAEGRVEIRDIVTGNIAHTVSTGIGPDAVVIDPTGQFALVPNEAEAFIFNPAKNTFSSAPGSLTLLTLSADPSNITATQIPLTEIADTAGFVKPHHNRFLEREIDWNHDGEISEENSDLNGNGKIDNGTVEVGTFQGESVIAKEKNGELFMFPIRNNKPDILEPEYVVFSQDGHQAWINLQENNGVIVLDTKTATITRIFGLGTTRHLADIKDDGHISFDSPFIALREPDGIALTTDGKYLITADEGDTDPKASKVNFNVSGGGRTISVFDAQTGDFLGDTQNQIDAAVHAAGFYPESRSDNKGSEPEMVTTFELAGVQYAAVGLERANGVALISLADPKDPIVISVAAIDPKTEAGKIAPEGIAHFYDTSTKQHYLYTANEKNGSLSVFRIDN